MKLGFDSKVVLGFSTCMLIVWLINVFIKDFAITYFAFGSINWQNPLDYFRAGAYVIGHANWAHLFGNLSYILLLGPIIEEKYGSIKLLFMILVTTFIVSAIHLIFSSDVAMFGSSGIVFMMIVLASYVGKKEKVIPLTFIAVALLFLGKELADSFKPDNVSQLAHLAGGIMGAVFGMIFGPSNGFEKKIN